MNGKKKFEFLSYDHIKISIASPDTIRSWSYGEVLRPETINYRTLKPEKDGLFCERIFGTTKEYECSCGKFKSIRYKGVVCDRCGVEVTHTKVRRERMGHIELSCPVAHIWFYKAVPTRIGLLLDMSINVLKSILFYEKYVVVDAGEVPDLKRFDLLTEEQYYEKKDQYGEAFRAGIGAEVIRELLMDLKIPEESNALRDKMAGSKVVDPRKLVRLRLLENFAKSGNKPDWMVMDVVPVIPPELRPMVQLEGGRFATSDLNDLYRRLINRNNRLKKLIALKAPDIIIKNEKRMLQEAVDALFDNARRKRAVKGAGNRPLKSLSDILKGKTGRFRQNLLGKRVDYSGRSVVVVGPDLKLHQCGLPRKMAIELFKPFIMRKLVEKKLVFNIKSAKKVIDNEFPEVWRILEEVVAEHPVLLNRAPTLHRLGIQAFEPVLTDEKAIRLHPLVCTAYNADFDGDQMAVHVPLSSDAQIEAWTLMLSSKNLLDPANGKPIVNPSQDMVLGIWNLTSFRRGTKDEPRKGEGKTFGSVNEVVKAFDTGALDFQAPIKLRDPSKESGTYETSAGRVIFSQALPEGYPAIDGFLNERAIPALDDGALGDVIEDIYKKYGTYATTVMLDKIKDLGFHFSTYYGNTIAVSDILVPKEKDDMVSEAKLKVEKIFDQYRNGVITADERYQQVISEWTSANDKITKKMMERLKVDQDGHNNLFIMATSGARGSIQQIRQLAGMRGLMAKPSGDIIELPITSNFKEGLSVLEYFISTHGARKGLSDTALKTADAGYLTRKLVDIAQDVTIENEDCGTINGIWIRPRKDGDEITEPLSNRIAGHFTCEPVLNPYNDEVILGQDEYISPETAKKIDELEIEQVKIRAVVTCESAQGICRKCYGENLATGKLVDIGEAVGILASQSIGQPGTQLTMRTFHIGGVASGEAKDPDCKLPQDSVIMGLPNNLVKNEEGGLVIARRGSMDVSRVFGHWSADAIGAVKVSDGDRVKAGEVLATDKSSGQQILAPKAGVVLFPKKAAHLMVVGAPFQLALDVGGVFQKQVGELILKGETVYRFDPINEPIVAELAGTVYYEDLVANKTLKDELDEYTGVTNKRVDEAKGEDKLQPRLVITNDKGESITLDLPKGALLYVEDKSKVKVGQVLAGKIRTSQKTADITGGLPRVQELFEARNPGVSAVVAAIDGTVKIDKPEKGKRPIQITNEFGDVVKHFVPAGRALLVRNGDPVKCGEALCEGDRNPHDILRVQGEIALYEFVLANVQEVYERQGVDIHDRHVGVIIRQMLRKVEIVDPGDTVFIRGELVDKYRLREQNQAVHGHGGMPAVAVPSMLGLTKASLNTESFISAASFQETTKVLTNAAIRAAKDDLRGLKENVIIGHKIPAGTGKKFYQNVSVFKTTLGDLDFLDTESDDHVEKVDETPAETAPAL